MNVLMLETSGWGGVSHYSHCLSQALSQYGISTTLVTNEVYELRNRERDYEILTILKDGGNYPERMRTFLRTLRSESPTVLHIQSGFSARRDWLMLPLFKKHCEEIIVTAHNILPHEEAEKQAKGMEFTLGRIYRSCDGIIVHSAYSKDLLTRRFSIDESKVVVIPHGNYLFLSNGNGDGLRAPQYERGDSDTILFFGHLRQYKGVDILIRAFSRVRRLHENALLVIAGKGQGRITQEYERIIAEEGVSGSVLLKPGYVDDGEIGSMFSQARLVVLPYRESDGSGALQLAYAFGKPVVATAVGVFPEIVEEGINGFLVPPEDPNALAGAILRLLELPPYETYKMGEVSRLMAERNFGWDKIAEMTVEFYKSLL
ncbi:MAG: glycosyltransferase family 4 protein [Candidatus Glassbacteria bacterium]